MACKASQDVSLSGFMHFQMLNIDHIQFFLLVECCKLNKQHTFKVYQKGEIFLIILIFTVEATQSLSTGNIKQLYL